jgi:predicted dehydrogenase
MERAAALEKLGARTVWFCDSDPARAEALASKFGSSWIARPEDLDLGSLDAVFVCLPPGYRGPIELQCLAHSIPLFVEKPIGLSAEHAIPLLELLQRSRVINAVGYMNRYRNSVRLAREVLSGRKVLGITCAWVGRKYRVPWWNDKDLSGGPFNEQATHVVDLCRCLVGEVGATASVAAPSENRSDPEYGVAVALQFLNGAVGTVFYNCEAKEKDIRLNVFCEEGTVTLEGWDFAMTQNSIDGTLPEAESAEIFLKETQAFLNALGSNDQSLIECDFAEAYQTQRVVDRIRESFTHAGDASSLQL